ncbi:MAG: helix-turn-helix transcriptional regulator [Solobacterium sp.]|jgi:transcriptional regulator with XRE-family HTH domain|nr:helix-turn-helix transcriptional regulator [Solobacterium sp.]
MHQYQQEELHRRIMIRLRTLRREHGYTQEQLAALLHISKSKVSEFENGKIPRIEDLIGYCDLFGVDMETLLSDEKEQEQISGTYDEEEIRLLEDYRECPEYAQELIQVLLEHYGQRHGKYIHGRMRI